MTSGFAIPWRSALGAPGKKRTPKDTKKFDEMMQIYREVKDLPFPCKGKKNQPYVADRNDVWKIIESNKLIPKLKKLHQWTNLEKDAVRRIKGLIDQEIPQWSISARSYVSGIGEQSGSVCVGLMSRGDT